MSNLIKASLVRYTDEVKKFDLNPLADAYQKEYVDKYIMENIALKQVSFDDVSKKLAADPSYGDSFKPGILAERIAYAEEDNEGGIEDESFGVEAADTEADEQRLAELRAEADSVLEDARREAEQILAEAREQAEAEREEILAGAHDEGYSAGMSEAEAEVQRAREEFDSRAAQLAEDYDKKVRELEPAFTELVIRYLTKLTGIVADDRREIILYLIDTVIKGHNPGSSFIIRVCPEAASLVRDNESAILEQLPDCTGFEVVEDPILDKNRCMIETESRIFDCSLDESLRDLTEDLRLLLEKE